MHHQLSRPFIPCVRAFHNPALGKYDEALGLRLHRKQIWLIGADLATDLLVRRMTNHVHVYSVGLEDGLRTLACVSGIDEQCLNLRVLLYCCGDYRMCAISILNAGCSHTDRQQRTSV